MKTSAVPSRSFFQKSMSMLLLVMLFAGCILMGGAASASAETAELTPTDIYEQNVPSTVSITTNGKATSRYGNGYSFQAAGSGFIITSDGYILTNYHVVKNADTVKVATFDDVIYEAKLIGYDESSDIAILKVDAENLRPVVLGDSDKLRVGDYVYAIGNPLGELSFSLTHGIVSALSRNVKTGSGAAMRLIQTDCAINSGNSGGALFNSRGEVIGITNAKYSSSGFLSEAEIDNICFAIPISSVTRIVTSIIENGYILKPYIGISVVPLSDEISGITGIDAGAVVVDITEGAPADLAGLKIHDIIVRINSIDIKDSNTLVQAIANANPGDVMTFYIYRQGQELQLDVEIGSKTETAQRETAEPETATPAPQEQPNNGQQPYSGQQPGIPGWGSNPFEEFFRYYFGY